MRPRKILGALLAGALAASLLAPAAAQAEFAFLPGSVSAVARAKNGTPTLIAGSHPYSYEVSFAFKTGPDEKTEGGEARDVIVDLPPGLIGNPQAVPQCPRSLFEGILPLCPPETQIGVLETVIESGFVRGPVYNLAPAPGVAAELGFSAAGFIAAQNASVRSEEGYGVRVDTQLPTEVRSATATIWGIPGEPSHDPQRGHSAGAEGEAEPFNGPILPFLTMPSSCEGVPQVTVRADSKPEPGIFEAGRNEVTVPAFETTGAPSPLEGCEAVPFSPEVSATPTTRLTDNPSGLQFELGLPNLGLLSPGAIAETEPEAVVVALPAGVTLNPSAAEGIATCSEAQFRAEGPTTEPGEGCPQASKLGSLTGHSPLLDELIEGSLYLATPYENPTGQLLALYLVARAGQRGVMVKQAGEVEPDPLTGQLITYFEELPPLPFSDFKLHFREGARAPLVSPPTCGTYTTEAALYPFSEPESPTLLGSSFTIDHGTAGGPCPSGPAPFNPGFEAGSLNNAAGHYSPFTMRLTRQDGDQDITRFSAKLPPGVSARLATTAECSDAAIAAARARTGPHGGREELQAPSCPADSAIGHVIAAAGVGQVLTRVPGTLYLAGPYNGAPLSAVAIVPGLAGPFDVGTVVTRVAVRVNEETGQVSVDGAASDPIPHILRGIPLRVREILVAVDKPNFTLNPTSCKEAQSVATIGSGGQDPFNPGDDESHTKEARFQAASCASLPFAPKLAIKLKGSTKRAGHPALTATLTYPKGGPYANVASAQVGLPPSEFLDQGNLNKVCTQPELHSNSCPASSVYGHAKAWTPLLDKPLEGPVYLGVGYGHRLPDVVADLNGQVRILLHGKVDTTRRHGLRNTFEVVPDAPVEKFVLELKGGPKYGLLENSENTCGRPQHASARFSAQNGAVAKLTPKVQNGCRKPKRHHHRHH